MIWYRENTCAIKTFVHETCVSRAVYMCLMSPNKFLFRVITGDSIKPTHGRCKPSWMLYIWCLFFLLFHMYHTLLLRRVNIWIIVKTLFVIDVAKSKSAINKMFGATSVSIYGNVWHQVLNFTRVTKKNCYDHSCLYSHIREITHAIYDLLLLHDLATYFLKHRYRKPQLPQKYPTAYRIKNHPDEVSPNILRLIHVSKMDLNWSAPERPGFPAITNTVHCPVHRGHEVAYIIKALQGCSLRVSLL